MGSDHRSELTDDDEPRLGNSLAQGLGEGSGALLGVEVLHREVDAQAARDRLLSRHGGELGKPG